VAVGGGHGAADRRRLNQTRADSGGDGDDGRLPATEIKRVLTVTAAATTAD